MDDGLAHARSQTEQLQEALVRLGSAVRRWAESADGTRAAWDDGAGRAVFQRFLDPHRQLLEAELPVVSRTLEGHEAALDRLARAGEQALRAGEEAVKANAEADSARCQAAQSRAESASAQSERAHAQALTRGVREQLAGLAD